MNRVTVVGASAAGLSVAESLRRLGYGGQITFIGQEPHLPYDRPPLSKQILTGAWGPQDLSLRTPDEIDALGLDLRLGVRATALDSAARSVTLDDGAHVFSDAVVIATGVRPRRLPGTDNLEGVHVLRTLEDAVGLRARLAPGRRLVIVGAGFIGAEVAAVARGLGVTVTMLEAEPVPLARAVGDQVGRFLTETHLSHGVNLRTGVTLTAIHAPSGAVEGVELSDGTTVATDDVLVAIGSIPNTDWLSGSGLEISNGVACDEHGAAVPGVLAVGDVARWHNPLTGHAHRIEHRTHAGEQALVVARNLAQPSEQPASLHAVPYFWSDQYDLKIQAYGSLRGHDEALVVDGDLSTTRTGAAGAAVAYRTGGRLSGVLAINTNPKVLRSWRALISAATNWADVLDRSAA